VFASVVFCVSGLRIFRVPASVQHISESSFSNGELELFSIE
jgi:hypothetical protein